jgi:tripartite-type tricarboxylate transporter receptor subunit TctC
MITKRAFLSGGAAALAGSPWAWARAEGGYPNKPIRLVIATGPGGAGSVLALILSEGLHPALGQPVVMDYKPGASGNIAGDNVAHAPADGYTVLLAFNSLLAINPLLFGKMPFDPSRDFVPVANAIAYPNILVVPRESPLHTLEDIRKAGKTTQLSHASVAVGSTAHLAGELFARELGIQLLHVPYKSAPAARQDVVGGRISMMFTDPSAIPLIKDGRLRALAVSGAERVEALADVPTLQELGMKHFDVQVVFGVVAPAKTPPEAVKRLETEIGKVLAREDVKEKFSAMGIRVANPTTADAFGRRIRQEVAVWTPVVKELNIHLD